MGKYFGTDGFRGEANKDLTVDHAFKIGRYLGWYYNEKADKATCQSYWRKVKELDPTNTEADQFLQ